MTTPAPTPDLAAELAELDAVPETAEIMARHFPFTRYFRDVEPQQRCVRCGTAWPCDTTVVLRELRSLRARPPVDVERLADMAALRRDVLAMQPVRRTFAYRQGFDDAVLIVLARLRAAAVPAGEDRG